jgi:5-methylthioribose kinase
MNNRSGILYPTSVFEDLGHDKALLQTLTTQLEKIWADALGFCGCEIIRRTLGLAHIIEYEDIESDDLRARCEAAGLAIARRLLLEKDQLQGMSALLQLIHSHVPSTEISA